MLVFLGESCLCVVQLPAGSWHGLPCWWHGLCMRCVVSCGSTSFPWLVFFFGALLSGSMIHKHTGRWMWQGSASVISWNWEKYCYHSKLAPEGRPGMSDVSPLSGLSFDSTLPSPLLVFCLVLLLFLSYLFFSCPLAHSPELFAENSLVFFVER